MRPGAWPVLFALAALPACAPLSEDAGQPRAGCQVVRVVDGDTVDLACPDTGRERARLIGYDTPETYRPGCSAEARLGAAATYRLRSLVAGAGQIETRRAAYDRYGRRLVQLRIDGRDIATSLVSEGLAVPYAGGRRIDWCARLS